MAIAFEVVYTFEDDDGDSAESAIKIPSSPSIAQFTEFAQAMAQLIDPIVSGLISSAGVRVSIDISALTGNIKASQGDVQDVGAFRYRTGDARPVRVNVPAISEALVLANSDDLDTAAPAVSAFNTAMLSGIAVVGGTIQPCDVDEDDIVTLSFARERFRAK